MCRVSTSHKATGWASARGRNIFRLRPMPWLPTPMNPTVIRSLAGTAQSPSPGLCCAGAGSECRLSTGKSGNAPWKGQVSGNHAGRGTTTRLGSLTLLHSWSGRNEPLCKGSDGSPGKALSFLHILWIPERKRNFRANGGSDQRSSSNREDVGDECSDRCSVLGG
jgi:hypothetical protein